jgi:signal peptidase I
MFQRRARPSSDGAADRMVRPRGLAVEIAEVAILAAVLYIVISVAIQTVHVIGLSMYPTVGDKDLLIATKVDYMVGSPHRGDIIILKDPTTDPTSPDGPPRDFIKRVIGVPGDRVLIRDGHTYVNGRLLEEPYISPEPWTYVNSWPNNPTGDPQGFLLQPGQYFVMGDNRNHSEDSRFFGPISRDEIVAHVQVRILPLDRIGLMTGNGPVLEPQVTLPAAA